MTVQEQTTTEGAVEYEVSDGIATIWLNRPHVRNCFNWEQLTTFGAALERAEEDDDARVVVIRGRGHTFFAGADLNMLDSEFLATSANSIKIAQVSARTFDRAFNLAKPTIAAVEGYAVAGGLRAVDLVRLPDRCRRREDRGLPPHPARPVRRRRPDLPPARYIGLRKTKAAGILTGPVNPACYTGTIQSANSNFKQGAVQQFNLNIERQMPGNIMTVGYAGSRSHHILVSQENENINDPNACPDGFSPVAGYTVGCGYGYFPLAVNQPNGGAYQTVASNNSIGNARYDSLQVKAETKSSRHGLYALLGYTWSRTFDSGMSDGLGTNPGATWPLPGTQRLDWGLSQLNLNDSFTASILYDLPFGKGKQFGGDWNGATNAVWEIGIWT